MAKRLTTEEVRHIAMLARLGMTEAEVERMRDQLSNILEQFDALSRLDVANVEPTGHSVDVNTVLRDDVPRESLPIADALANAPRTEGDFVRVRAVLEE
ncbi:MAG: Asp-tRNA(Asn)/Glu-tRNA(Gln) amidotransferase subunit GatC [SAR202 cluster bacterium]|nr:Asp-tRNA(Asn)/Glu-tRNA(Gln) amidotransferase subunit GatC [SAR202 cluster bacterium]